MLYFGGMIGSMLALTLFLQLGEGFSAIHAGLTLAPFALGTAVTAPVAAQTDGRIGGRTLIQIGGLVSMLGLRRGGADRRVGRPRHRPGR